MSKIGIFFGTDTGSTRLVAKSIFKQLGEDFADKPKNINRTSAAELLQYDALILGTPSYGRGELPGLSTGCLERNWEEFMPYLDDAFKSKNYQKMYPKEMLDFKSFVAKNQCPENDRLCNEEAVWLSQSMLLGTKSDMDDIATAIEKVHKNAGKIKK